jgi:subtilisin family serine protease
VRGVTHVGPDLLLSLDLPAAQMVAADVAIEGVEDNDLYMAYQWDIKRVGGDADTWAIEKGAGATVAVLDTGVFAAHPDIAQNYAYGKDFTDITGELPPGWIMWDEGGPQDYNGHGTHVAGSIAGTIDAGRIIGVAPGASIANYKVMVAVITDAGVATGIGYQSWIVDGIVTAADDGVHVINMSLGGWRYLNEPGGAAAYVSYLRATQYARQQGTLVVASSGNSGLDLTKLRPAFHVPSGTPAAMSINATGPDDSLAFYSNYGVSETRVVGPGGDLSDDPFSWCLSAYSPLNAWAPGAGWVFSIGTSMAAPKVAGVAALVYAHNPGIKPSQVEGRLMQTAEDLGTPGFDPMFGHGMAHAYRALTNTRK